MDNVSYRQKLAQLIEQAGNKLREEDSNTASLRKIQLFLKNTSHQWSMSNDEYFLIFFLDSFIEKVFFNLVGDVPYKKGVTKEIQTRFYNETGKVLADLSEKLQQDALSTSYLLYAQLGILYLKVVDELNNNLMAHEV